VALFDYLAHLCQLSQNVVVRRLKADGVLIVETFFADAVKLGACFVSLAFETACEFNVE
jgi:hypothetical protein